MELLPLPDGKPGPYGGRLGVVHTMKHYLNPAEAWEDVVPDGVARRPDDVHARLGPLDPPVYRRWCGCDHGEAVAALWERELVPAYREGYYETVKRLAYSLPAPGGRGWRPCSAGRDRWASVCRVGVMIVASLKAHAAGRLVTAYRPGLPLAGSAALPDGAEHRALRNDQRRHQLERGLASVEVDA